MIYNRANSEFSMCYWCIFIPLRVGESDNDRPVVIVISNISDRGGRGRISLLALVICLHLQQCDGTSLEIIIFLAARAILFRCRIKEQAAETIGGNLEHHELRAVTAPVER